MTSRDRTVLLVVVTVALLGAYWLLLLSPKRHDASSLGDQVAEVHKRLDAAHADVAASGSARSSYAANYVAVARLGKAVPAEEDVPSLVYQLDQTATSMQVDFRKIKLSQQSSTPASTTSAAAVASTRDAAGPQTTGSGLKSGTGTGASSGAGQNPSTTPTATSPSSSTTPASTPPTQAASATAPPGTVVGPGGFPTLPFQFTFTGSFFRLSNFFGRVERFIQPERPGLNVSGRLMAIDGFQLSASPLGFPHMEATVAATAFVLPQDQGLTNGATPGAPPQAGSQTVSTSPSSTTPPVPAAAAKAVP
jgi:hypothetical protein